ncbi:class A beta-lactamase-related serine hydrolase [Hymenobacter sp. 15J16-1T3B]|uniref:serine hydrolase n=1 Tax=Hymenobacter sp. 15J16-1T3B TaxID=2886941 RepID=UPI001D1020E7|nr:serine hydrolase [Hymenobacter sp. 15J16-1T3B]MCC3160009.1 class A beta-lactamase-related serine hydrolase [Hymenobacter sp. 15J16-1T3B]
MMFGRATVFLALALSVWLPAGGAAGRVAADKRSKVGFELPNPLDSLLRNTPGLASVVRQADKYELQIIYTRIDRDATNTPHFTQYDYRLDERAYFNPASLVKLPVSILALQKLNELRRQTPALSRRTIMSTGVAGRCQTAVPFAAPADSDRVASVGNYIKRMLLVSDNQAYNRLYEFLGQQYLHEQLSNLGFSSARITRRFAPCDTAANRCTNPISFHEATGAIIYSQPAACNLHPLLNPLGRVQKGRGYYAGGRLVSAPYDFTTANYLPLQTVTDLLRGVLFPQSIPADKRPTLSEDDLTFLQYYLAATPHDSGFHLYTSSAYFPAYKKYLFYGRQPRVAPQAGLRIYNIVGMSHGYLADCAYFTDGRTGVEFMLSAVLYVNADGILNDGQYEYTSVGLPFMAQLGQAVYALEQARPRVIPQFSRPPSAR